MKKFLPDILSAVPDSSHSRAPMPKPAEMKSKHQKISWSEPKWRYVPELKNVARQVLSLSSWIRILFLVFLLVGGMAWFLNEVLPDLEFDWIRVTTLIAITVLLLYLIGFLAFWLIPPEITLTGDTLRISEGQSVSVYSYGDIEAASIDISDTEKPYLVIKVDNRFRTIGISKTVNVSELNRLLEEKLKEKYRISMKI